MIVVAGFNTSIDRFLEVDALEVGGLTRARGVTALPGGKGLHVALTAAALGEAVELIGIIDAKNHGWFASFLQSRGVTFVGVSVPSEIRTCIAIKDGLGKVTEILEPGPEISGTARSDLFARFVDCARRASVVVLSGSLPPGLEESTYRSLVSRLDGAPVSTLLDSSGDALRLGIEARPFLLKPNKEEAEQLTGVSIVDQASAHRVARELGEKSPVAVLSLGAQGAVASWEGRLAEVLVPRLPVVNPVGSGDCLLGGIAVGLARRLEPEAVLRLGAACGTANVLSRGAGTVQKSDILASQEAVTVRWLD